MCRHNAPSAARMGMLFAGIGLVLFAGCQGEGNKLGRKAISGNVTLDGKPLAEGAIRFEPMKNLSGSAASTTSGGMIKDGQYSLSTEQGLPDGMYAVSITASAPQSTVAPGEDAMKLASQPPPESLIPARYNSNTELTVEVSSQKTTFSFDLESASKADTSPNK